MGHLLPFPQDWPQAPGVCTWVAARPSRPQGADFLPEVVPGLPELASSLTQGSRRPIPLTPSLVWFLDSELRGSKDELKS